MKFHVNADCIGCGASADVTGPDEAAATDAMQTCPVGAIESVDG